MRPPVFLQTNLRDCGGRPSGKAWLALLRLHGFRPKLRAVWTAPLLRALLEHAHVFALDGDGDGHHGLDELHGDLLLRVVDARDLGLLAAERPAHELDDVDRKSTRLNSSHIPLSRMPSS